MKLASYVHDGAAGVGVLDDADDITPLPGVTQIDESVADLLATFVPGGPTIPLADVTLRAASPAPSKVFCVGLNYLSHVEETKRDLPVYPVLFPKFASNLIGANEPIRVPEESTQVDYEGELAVIIGRRGRRITEEDAMEHVLGVAVANDVTMRDYQYKTHQWLQGKAWDGSTPIGPVLVTPDEVDLANAGIRTILNGETVQNSDLSRLIFSIPTLIAKISEFTVLEPGDIILTGTPSGVGFRRDPQVFLHPGDHVTVEIDGVGRLDSAVVAE
ncbi:fumarylacetoacetate hydrolase family protein [Microbacterium maritypicum]|uniref:fumarylacetoacetate hydrolase family protein n=1 Tax=Microbacterium maritypicum TaxID=33918 RepID=UPI00381396E9